MIDLHTHILPGIDDGPATQADALAMLRVAHAAGTRTMVATPHVSARYPDTRAEGIAAAVEAIREIADGIGVHVPAGAELELLHREALSSGDLAGLRLGDGTYTLVELPFSASGQFAEMLLTTHTDVQPAVIAHPERCRAFHADGELLGRLIDQGMVAQLTAGSFEGAYGSTVKDVAWRMLDQGLVHVVASDGHGPAKRRPLLREPLDAAGLGQLVPALCQDGPAAILAGHRPDPVAAPRRRRGLLGRRR